VKDSSHKIAEVRAKYKSLQRYLNEKSRRIWAATESEAIGWGGLKIVCEATGLSKPTVVKGRKELRSEQVFDGRLRKKGGGRKPLIAGNKELEHRLDVLIEPYTKGDPMNPLRWTSKSTYKLSGQLCKEGKSISPSSVGRLLKQQGYSLQGNRKDEEGGQHQYRDAQFEFINEKVKRFLSENKAAISVDTKKKENIGNYKNGGREYHRKGAAPRVKVHDFKDKKLGKVAPYGIYDIGQNEGFVNVGISRDTAEFAVNSIRCWWYQMGKERYGGTTEILITADCGGSNGYRTRLWKVELQKLANELNKIIHVCHFPPGTSKWNKIEHKMFCYISKNWRGKPLISREAVVQLIGNTSTNTGLIIQQRGIKVSDEELAAVNVVKEDFHGEWNYSIHPKR
jgi:hypothetical protein